MSGQWKEMARIAFKGERFRDRALDLAALDKLGQFQRLLARTAKALWRAKNPDARRLPRGFESQTRLYLRRIEADSAVVPLEVFVEDEQLKLPDPAFTRVSDAITLVYRAFDAAAKGEALPGDLPKSQVHDWAQWANDLADDEAIEFQPVGRQPARITGAACSRLEAFAETGHESAVTLTGEVVAADVRRGRFQICLDDGARVDVSFTNDQEEQVTSALKDHKTCRLAVHGRAEHSPQGKPLRITQVEELEIRPVGYVAYDAAARPIEEILAELAAEVPPEEWKKLPADLSDNLDHYIYGTPK